MSSPFHDPWLAANSVLQAEVDRLTAINAELLDALEWTAVFADVRSQDDSKTFARVNRGALRTIRDKAREAIAKVQS